MRGNHSQSQSLASKPVKKRLPLVLPFNLPTFMLNTVTVKAFNELYYHAQTRKIVNKIVPYDPFFYPLDSIHDWYRMYGKRGFLQYQFVVPFDNALAAMSEIVGRIRQAGDGSFLTVLKTFGDIPSPGILSFPRPGLTLALDFAYGGQKTLQFLNDLDTIVIQAGGALYPAKDARMSAQSFQTFYPQWKQFAQHIDPHFSSSFWRRVTSGSAEEQPFPVHRATPQTLSPP
ncbi:MAG: hypothetical protein ACXVDN_18555 [Ktedonobacteraceae bacterium]